MAAAPLVPLGIFRSRALSGANVVVFCLGAAVFGMWYFVSLYLQEVLGYSPLQAGLALVVMPLAIALCTQAAIRLTGRLGPGPVLAGGMTLIGVGHAAARRASRRTGRGSPTCRAGDRHLLRDRLRVRPGHHRRDRRRAAREAGLASGLVNTSRQMGGSLGLALLATVASQRTAALAGHVPRAEALTQGFARALALGGGIALAGAVITVAVLVRTPRVAPAGATR